MKKFTVAFLAIFAVNSIALAQQRQRTPNFSDSSTARLHQITSNDVDSWSVSGKQNAAYYNDESTFNWVSCNAGYQNRSTVPIFVNIEAMYGHRSMTGLLVKRSFTAPWVNSGFVRDAGISTIMVPPGAVYCPITNHHWGLWWISVPTVGQGDYAFPVKLYDYREVRGPTITVNGTCYLLTQYHVNYRQDGTVFSYTYYGVDFSSGVNPIEVDVSDPRVVNSNTCIPSSSPTDPGGGAQ